MGLFVCLSVLSFFFFFLVGVANRHSGPNWGLERDGNSEEIKETPTWSYICHLLILACLEDLSKVAKFTL